jgi:hypothetical protein
MKCFLPILLLIMAYSTMQGQGCLNINKYHEKMAAADSCIAIGNYSLAQDNYNAAIVYCEEKSDEIESAKEILFQKIDKLRIDAEKANELFSIYSSISINFLIEEDLKVQFLDWVVKNGREDELDAILYTLIDRARSMETEQEKQKWRNLMPLMTTEQKVKLLDIRLRETAKLRDIEEKYERIKDLTKVLLVAEPIMVDSILQSKNYDNVDELAICGVRIRSSDAVLSRKVLNRVLELDAKNPKAFAGNFKAIMAIILV